MRMRMRMSEEDEDDDENEDGVPTEPEGKTRCQRKWVRGKNKG